MSRPSASGLVPRTPCAEGSASHQSAYTFMVDLLERLGYHEEALEVATRKARRARSSIVSPGGQASRAPRSARNRGRSPAATVADVRATAATAGLDRAGLLRRAPGFVRVGGQGRRAP